MNVSLKTLQKLLPSALPLHASTWLGYRPWPALNMHNAGMNEDCIRMGRSEKLQTL
jgi:hypothetical protein